MKKANKEPADHFTEWDKIIRTMKIRKLDPQPDPLLIGAYARIERAEKELQEATRMLKSLDTRTKRTSAKTRKYEESKK